MGGELVPVLWEYPSFRSSEGNEYWKDGKCTIFRTYNPFLTNMKNTHIFSIHKFTRKDGMVYTFKINHV